MYSREFREEMILKLLSPGGPTIPALAERTGVGKTTLARWKGEYLRLEATDMVKPKRPSDWTAEEKLQAILDTHSLSETETGAWCRTNGLHVKQLDLWREQVLAGIRKGPKSDPEKKALRTEILDLERELRRKEKALTEAAALLVLKKKAQAFLGAAEDD